MTVTIDLQNIDATYSLFTYVSLSAQKTVPSPSPPSCISKLAYKYNGKGSDSPSSPSPTHICFYFSLFYFMVLECCTSSQSDDLKLISHVTFNLYLPYLGTYLVYLYLRLFQMDSTGSFWLSNQPSFNIIKEPNANICLPALGDQIK